MIEEEEYTPAFMARIRTKLSIGTAAHAIGIHPIILNGIERGHYPPSKKSLEKLEKLYEQPIIMSCN